MPRILKRFSIGLASLAALALLLFLCRAPILRTAAHIWIIDTPPARADAIVVLGGGIQYRPFTAAKLYLRGLAPQIVIFRVKPYPTKKPSLTPTEQQLTRQILIDEGVPESAILEIGHDVASTRDEALAVRAWTAAAKPRSLLIPTDPFHTRRVHWLFRKTLHGTSATPTITIARRSEYTAENWWTTELGLIDFQNEVIKYVFYRIKY
jgi:uncharacterized SAM-binding protein YcdF (DUF218 family)